MIIDLQAPHHNAGSWALYWTSHHDLPDKILASMRKTRDSSDDEEPKPKKKAALHRMPKYYESSPESELTEVSDEKEDAGDNIEIILADENKRGQQGGPFTKSRFVPDAVDLPQLSLGDLGVVARQVTTLPEVPQASLQDKWTDLTERVSPVVNLEGEHAANLPTSKKRKSRGKAIDRTKENEDELQGASFHLLFHPFWPPSFSCITTTH
jgi:hypothetical protein